jgi:hypothetical protein
MGRGKRREEVRLDPLSSLFWQDPGHELATRGVAFWLAPKAPLLDGAIELQANFRAASQ